jgi:hypothetical protein
LVPDLLGTVLVVHVGQHLVADHLGLRFSIVLWHGF